MAGRNENATIHVCVYKITIKRVTSENCRIVQCKNSTMCDTSNCHPDPQQESQNQTTHPPEHCPCENHSIVLFNNTQVYRRRAQLIVAR